MQVLTHLASARSLSLIHVSLPHNCAGRRTCFLADFECCFFFFLFSAAFFLPPGCASAHIPCHTLRCAMLVWTSQPALAGWQRKQS